MAKEPKRRRSTATLASDVWAHGVLMFEILTGGHLIPNVDCYQRLCSSSFPAVPLDAFIEKRLSRFLGNNVRGIVQKCLKTEPHARLSAAKVHHALAEALPNL